MFRKGTSTWLLEGFLGKALRDSKKVTNATAIIWKMLLVAEETFRHMKAPELTGDVFLGAKYADGSLVQDEAGEGGCLGLFPHMLTGPPGSSKNIANQAERGWKISFTPSSNLVTLRWKSDLSSVLRNMWD